MSVLVTGATGFLGLHLLRELLQQHPHLTVLARPDSAPALPRIQRFLQHQGATETDLRGLPQRLTLVHGDTTVPRFGLPNRHFRRLAERTEEIWHCAADISLTTHDPMVEERNVAGVRQILNLLSTSCSQARLYHASSIAAAGAQSHGQVPEEFIDANPGFTCYYEASKLRGEALIQQWCRQHHRGATVFRLGVLTTDRRPYPGRPRQPLEALAATLGNAVRQHPHLISPDGSITIPGAAEARVNLLPVEHAAFAMVQTACRLPVNAARVVHVVHPHGTPVTTLVAAALKTASQAGRAFTIRLQKTPDTTDTFLHDILGGFLAQFSITRSYDDTTLRTLGLACPSDAAMTQAYAERIFRSSSHSL